MSAHAASLHIDEVRIILQLGRELRALGAPDRWRGHLAASLHELIRARAIVVGELRIRPVNENARAVLLHLVAHGVDERARAAALAGVHVLQHAHEPLEALAPLYPTRFTAARSDLVDDSRWYRSRLAHEQLHLMGCDEFMISNAPADSHGVISSITLLRGPGEPRFSAPDRLLLHLIHEDLAGDWERGAGRSPHLSPRQRQVLALLAEGKSEKELAARLGMSVHTAHDHVKALHRRFGVHSRGELLARVLAPPERTRLWAELPDDAADPAAGRGADPGPRDCLDGGGARRGQCALCPT